MNEKTAGPDHAAGLRRRAEGRLRERGSAPEGRTRIETDAHRLVHELQVHKVELEMQNAELQEARDRTEALLAKYTDLYEFAPVGYLSLTTDGRIQLVNLTGARLLGLERSRLLGRPLDHQLTAESRPIFRALLKRVLGGTARQVCDVTLAGRGLPARTVSLEAARSHDQSGCRVVMTDITARKHAEAVQRRAEVLAAANAEANREIARRRVVEATLRRNERTQRKLVDEARELHAQLRRLTRQILQAQEEERKKISLELHDEVAQVLAGINVRLALLSEAGSVSPGELGRRIRQTQRLVVQSIEIVHRFARALRPAMLDDLGLIPALRSYIKDLPAPRGLRVRFTAVPEVESLDNVRRTVLYRIAQEALTNVIRHARARRVTVQISRTAGAVCLEVHDDGKSFPAHHLLASRKNTRLGLIGMRERVEMVGGCFTVESKPGHGTTVHAEIPVPPPSRNAKP